MNDNGSKSGVGERGGKTTWGGRKRVMKGVVECQRNENRPL